MNLRKRQVLDAALQLFIEKGFHNTSIQDILSKSMISKGTFYNYFSSKNECFMAILEQVRYEASLRRHEILHGNDPSDENILIEQIIVLMQINKEQNLVSIFEGIFQSNDLELRDALMRNRLIEVEWLSNRFVDIFGEEARPYTLELSILFFGMVQHLSMSFRTFYGVTVDVKKVVKIAFRNIKVVLPEMIATNDVIIGAGSLQLIEGNTHYRPITKDMILNKLEGFLSELQYDDIHTVGIQFTQTLIEQLTDDTLRSAVVEALLKPFRSSFSNTSHEAESIELSNMLWFYVKNFKET
ncbi:TetR/AcrR family transcriptional regulator [Solibacillus sp. MA9]|uniref:TetR/AcrR family transcriptional regulator n=1 Tax=Solibacillus palustris TaxID=2908203 RepID=A0ABS9UDI6_9BACL|nr:TetR/AcrR family transcriptional regulator [Solibacillus sp. MA9]MCH7322318.1 TetR/AcrR family transcriptional regulator [Solibacillus sp. MA9]